MKLLSVTRTNKFPGLTSAFSVFELSDEDLNHHPINISLDRIDTEKYKFYPKRYLAAVTDLLDWKLEQIAKDPQMAINFAFESLLLCGATYFIKDPNEYRFSVFADTPEEALKESFGLVEKFYNNLYENKEEEE